jgi:hypothetical protein
MREKEFKMTMTRIFSRGAAGVAAALISSALLVSAAFAQTPPFTVYGTDAGAGATVTVSSGDTTCATVTADAAGQWSARVESTCAAAGATVTATSGDSSGTAVAASGKASSITLVAAASSDDSDSSDDSEATTAPAPSSTGMAGLVASSTPFAAQAAAAMATVVGAVSAGFVARRRS